MSDEKLFEIVDFVRGDNVVIAFIDLCGFTKMVDKAVNADSENRIITILNNFYKFSSQSVYSHEGIIDKFLGDGIMALFGSIFNRNYEMDSRDFLLKAVEASLTISTFMDILGGDIGIPLKISTGIWMGDVFMGFSSSQGQNGEVSVIGDPVNVASRLQKSSEENQLLIPFIPDVDFKKKLDLIIKPYGMVKIYDKIEVKGKGRPLNVFRILPEELYWDRKDEKT